MSKYHSDQRDILFNLLDVLKIQDHEGYEFDSQSIKVVLDEFDKFVENEIFPHREASDKDGVTLTEKGVKVPEYLKPSHKAYYENGWFALGFPEEMGGASVPEAMHAACVSLSTGANAAWMMYPGLSRAALNVINLKGDNYLKATYLEPMMTGRYGGTMCLTEAGAGSDVGNLRTTATPIEGKRYKIKGSKIFISSGDNDFYENIVHLVLARTPNAPAGTKGISLFVVPKNKILPNGTMGGSNDVRVSKLEEKMGIHVSATCEMQFGENDNCEGYLIGDEFDGMATMFIMMNEARLYCGIQGEAQGNLAFLMATDYAKERVQFGMPIIKHPDVKRNLLRMRAQARGMRSLCLYTANLFDLAKKDPKYHDYIGLLTPICKAYCSEQGFNVAVDAVQAHGGYGFCREYGVEQFVRDTKIATIYEGTNGIQALDFVMRKILKDGGSALRNLSEDIFKTSNNLDDEDFTFEKGVFSKALASAQEAMGFIAKKAKKNEMNIVLQSCTDFLNLASTIVVAWRLMESAIVASKLLEKENSEEEIKYLKSKIVDFKMYCAHYLVHSVAYSKSIVGVAEDITTLEV